LDIAKEQGIGSFGLCIGVSAGGWLATRTLWLRSTPGGASATPHWKAEQGLSSTKGESGPATEVSVDGRGEKSEVLQGTLDLMILKTLNALGPLHGFGIARRIEQVSHDVLTLNEGTVYTSLLRLQQQRWIAAEWGTSENNRKAKFYSITEQGKKQLALETENWERISGVIGRVWKLEGER
jgi:PadR family transcriptional regulator PadR